jgi:hypothetical protein
MPGTFVVSANETFAILLLMASGPKLEFGTDSQAVSKTGEKKWDLQIAATWRPENGMRPVSEVINVSITGPAADPAGSLTAGTAIELESFRVGVSSPEMRDVGRGPRVSGGKAWYQASGVRAAHSVGQRPVAPVKQD